MSGDEAWAGLTFGPVPEPLRPAFRSALAGEPCEVEALKELRDRLPEGLIEEEGGACAEGRRDGEREAPTQRPRGSGAGVLCSYCQVNRPRRT